MNDLLMILKALSDKNRLRIIKLLQHRSCCVCEITHILKIATSTASNHLRILKETGIIEDTRDGKWVNYCLASSPTNPFLCGLLPLIAFWLNDDPQIAGDRRKLASTDRNELCST